MKKVPLFLLFIFFATHCFGQTQQKGCGDFKSGKFAYHDSADRIIEVTRKGNRQQEYDKKNKIITKFKISWTGECEYKLTQIWSNSKAKRKQNRSVIVVVITSANSNDSYEYSCGCRDREGKEHVGKMVRLSE